MTYFYAFLICGLICMIGQLILDCFKLTPGHITSMFVVLGAVLGCFGLYDYIRELAGAGASLPIISFGDLLFNAGYDGYKQSGILGIFSNLLSTTSAGITSAMVFAFILTIFSKPKD